jgi:tryptophan synthase alpha chain
MANRIDKAFRRAHKENRAAFMPFITAGDPDIEATGALIEEIGRRGADLIELGIPYSDPIADGPTIQASYVRALDRGLRLAQIFDMVRDVRTRCAVPILTMVSFSIVSKVGPDVYFEQASGAGVDGVIIPDLPADEGKSIARLARRAGLHPVFLVAPTTPDARMKEIARRSRGFIYYISVTGTTGARAELPPDLTVHIDRLRAYTKRPVAVGFGVSTPDQVRAVAQIADGVIVGSAIVRKIHELAAQPREALTQSVGDFVAQLAAAKAKA